MGAPVTDPDEWRRRAGDAPPVDFGPGDLMPGDLCTAVGGLACLRDGYEEQALEAARMCREVIWAQPEDVPGVIAGPGVIVLAHREGQAFGLLGTTVGFLTRMFAEYGNDADLDAASELHDLTVALGDAVFEEPAGWAVGWGAALLYAATGEDAFLATAERIADAMCEEPSLPDLGRALLLEMAEAVESRRPLSETDADPGE